MEKNGGLRLTHLAGDRRVELLLLLVGVILRVALYADYDPRYGYDYPDHARNILWWTQNFTIPPIDWSRAAYHPPLYPLLAGLVARSTWTTPHDWAAISLFAGCLRLALIYVGLRLYLPGQRMARIVALAIAVVLPASVHSDVMLTNEPLSGLLVMVALVLVPPSFRAQGRSRWLAGAALGLALGLAALVKVSALVIVAAVGLGTLVELARNGEGGARGRLQRLAPILCGLTVFLLTSGWYFAHCQRHYGKFIVTGFDGPARVGAARVAERPYFDRRPLSFFLGWNADIYAHPYYPSAVLPDARFFPVLVATTFVDYYNYGLGGYPKPDEEFQMANRRQLRLALIWPARLSFAAGTLIALCTAVAWAVALVWTWKRRAYAMLGLLLVPFLAVAGQAHFAVAFPLDYQGLIKGSYLQFAAAPLDAVFGVAVAWLWQRRWGRPVALVLLAALAVVAAYVVFCLALP